MLKLWGRLTSINVRKVVWTLQELGLPFERTDAGLAYGLTRTPAYLAMNPNALVPTLDDDGYVLWESNVIVRYLCARYGATPAAGAAALLPQDLQLRFDAERWMDWQQTTLNPAGREAFIQWFRTPADQRQPERIARSVAATEPLLAQLDAHLANRHWMLGPTFSVADIPVACDVHRWFGLPQPRPAWPHLQRWWNAIQARPATRGVFDVPLG